ncbi:hypothetical protein ACLOJK_005660 [Asimina triloba]
MAKTAFLLSPFPNTLRTKLAKHRDLQPGFRSLPSRPSKTLEFKGLGSLGRERSGIGRVSAVNSGTVLEKPEEKGLASEGYDAIVIGSGIGGLVAGTQLAVKGAKVLVLEKYVIPGGSSGYYQRDGYTFDVGSSVMFGFSDKVNFKYLFSFRRFRHRSHERNCSVVMRHLSVSLLYLKVSALLLWQGNLNLITQALAAVGCEMEVIPDPTTVHFHLPNDLSVRIFNALNSLELKSLEEPVYLFGQFFKKPLECLTLAYYLPQNAGDIARKYIQDPQLLSFIDAEVLCDRHYGGINYPVGGVGGIAKALAKGLVDKGSKILYKANATNIILDNGKAVGVRLSDGSEFFSKTIISNATRWDTFGKLLKEENLPKEEEDFQKKYVKAPSFLSIHMGVREHVLPSDTDCHHFVLELPDNQGCNKDGVFLYRLKENTGEKPAGLPKVTYEAKKEQVADEIISRLEKKLFPGLKQSIVFKEVGTPKTHRRFLARDSGTYGPMPRGVPKGLLGMPFNTTKYLSTWFSLKAVLTKGLASGIAVDGLYCVGDSCFPGQGVIAVAFSGVMCAHRVAADIGLEEKSPILDAALLRVLRWLRTLA